MHLKELNHRNPMRALERAVDGGLGRGNLGLVVGRPGTGKSAFLTGLALDHLLRGERVLHVSLRQTVEHIHERYEEIFAELASSANLEERTSAHEAVERNSIIRSFAGQVFSAEAFAQAIEVFEQHADFHPDLVVIGGYDFERPEAAGELGAILERVRGLKAELWMPVRGRRLSPKEDWHELPPHVANLGELPSVVLRLHPVADSVRIRLLKDHDNTELAELDLDLDPTTLLVKAG